VTNPWILPRKFQCGKVLLLAGLALQSVLFFHPRAFSQTGRPDMKTINAAAGDTVDNPGPVDSSLSPKLTARNVQRAMKKVADWQLAHSTARFNQDWTYAPLYSGLLAASVVTHDPKYHDAVLHAAESFGWRLFDGRYDHADDEAIGQSYEVLYLETKQPIRIAAVRENFDRLLARPDSPEKDLWWWCDALYMAPPSLAMMSKITGDRKYLDYMDREWDLTTKHLYDPHERLYSRDATFLDKKEANGSKVFWSRGNGWVLAGTARVLDAMPSDYPSRAKYEQLFRDMADRIAGLQQADGLWRTGLLDQDAYASPEISGSAFFTYAMAWGVNHRLLDPVRYRPVIEKAWAGMLKHVYQDGRLGSIQPIGAAPGAFSPGSSYVYGVGAFLLAGASIDEMARHTR
jgi:unsaturated rhamnogalacturonyl hydrolase